MPRRVRRENWRPFAHSVQIEKAGRYFQDFKPSPYMILSFWADKARAHEIPAVVHVDGRVPDDVLKALRKVAAVEQAKAIRLF